MTSPVESDKSIAMQHYITKRKRPLQSKGEAAASWWMEMDGGRIGEESKSGRFGGNGGMQRTGEKRLLCGEKCTALHSRWPP